MFRLHCRDQARAKLMKAITHTPKKFASVVYRAGTKQGPSFDHVRDKFSKFDEGNLKWKSS